MNERVWTFTVNKTDDDRGWFLQRLLFSAGQKHVLHHGAWSLRLKNTNYSFMIVFLSSSVVFPLVAPWIVWASPFLFCSGGQNTLLLIYLFIWKKCSLQITDFSHELHMKNIRLNHKSSGAINVTRFNVGSIKTNTLCFFVRVKAI